jgi:2-oxoglutarate ferredoxin oxidoreductase subunit alpha
MKEELCIGFVGAGGAGVVSVGEMLIQACASEGLSAMATMSFGPQIRGGESSSKVRFSSSYEILSPGDTCDILVAYHLSEYPKFKGELELKNNSIIFIEHDDPMAQNLPFEVKPEMKIFFVPFQKLAKEEAKNPLAANIISLGVLAEILNLPYKGLINVIKKKFKKKGEEVISANLNALEIGRKFAREGLTQLSEEEKFLYQERKERLVLTGNDAVALGAIYAGCNFFAGYPITPSSEIMHFMSELLPMFGGKFLQVEDEISAICHCIGSSFAGGKPMTVTSGPGLSLMQEGIGLASMAEIPVVIVDVQRGGPSTGLPTKSEQADLLPAVFGTHGDTPKVVLAPADVQDCFDVTMEAFYAAEHFQMPAIVLSDQFLGHRYETIDKEKLLSGFKYREGRILPSIEDLENYVRYKDTPTGISPMAIPGMEKRMYLASGITHNEKGDPTSVSEIHEKMIAKRFRKLQEVRKELNYIRHYGDMDAKVAIVGWGSTKGVIKETVQKLQKEGYKIKGVVPQIIYPPNYKQFDQYVRNTDVFFVFEVSWNQQFAKYLKTYHLPKENQIQTYSIAGGRAIKFKEVYETVKEVLK